MGGEHDGDAEQSQARLLETSESACTESSVSAVAVWRSESTSAGRRRVRPRLVRRRRRISQHWKLNRLGSGNCYPVIL